MIRNYESVIQITKLDNLAKQFKLSLLVNPSPKIYRKFCLLEVANPQQPKLILHCSCCLYALGFGYDRIARHLGIKDKKTKVGDWIKRATRRWGLKKPKLVPRIKLPKEPKPRNTVGQSKFVRLTDEEWAIRKHKTNTQFKAKARLRSYFSQWLNHNLMPKMMPIIVGCDRFQFHHWMEAQFNGGMTWDNHGTLWQIDHRIPCKAYDLTKREDVLKCFHFTNLRPLKSKENMSKSDKIIPTQPELHMKY